MKYKFNKKIFLGIVFIISLILLIGILPLKYLNKKSEVTNTSQAISYDEERIVNLISEKSIIDIIYKDINIESKGPIPTFNKIAYITIDDGPSKYTNDILDILSKHNVKATFFMINDNMNKHPNEVKRIERQGHSAGFHSITHDIKKLYRTPQSTLEEFEICKDTYYSLTGEISKLIRLPYGSKPYMPQDSYEILNKYGYKIWDWNLDTQDWRATTDNIVSNVLYYGRNKSNIVLLMHEKQQTVDALDSMIKVLKERGYKILPITENGKELNFWEKNL